MSSDANEDSQKNETPSTEPAHPVVMMTEEEELAEIEAQQQGATAAPEPEEPNKKEAYTVHVSFPVHIETREDFDRVMVKHHDWLESVLNPSKKIGPGRANLKGANLSGWDLTGINLSGATLKEAKLVGTILNKANLTAADLSNADLQGADLRNCKLKRAILSHADLRDADLEGADMRDAKMDFVKLSHKAEDVTLESPEEGTALSENASEGVFALEQTPQAPLPHE